MNSISHHLPIIYLVELNINDGITNLYSTNNQTWDTITPFLLYFILYPNQLDIILNIIPLTFF